MAGSGRQIIVEIVGDAGKFTGTLSEAQGAIGKFTNVTKGIGLGIGSAAFDLAANAVSGFVSQLGDAAQAYRDDQVSQQKLATALKNNVPAWNGSTDAVEAYASAQQRLGFQDDDIRASISQLIGITHDQTEAMQLNSLAQDLARAKGLDLAQATDLVTKAHEGNGKALKALGIDIGDAKTAAELLDAVQQNVSGSAEAWAETAEGRTAVQQAKQAEAWEKIGAVVSRITDAVLPLATAALEVIADVISNVADAAQPVIDTLVQEFTPAFKSLTDFITKTAMPVIKEIAQRVIPLISSAVKTVWDIVKPILGLLGDLWRTEFNIIMNIIKTAIDVIQNIATTVSGVAKTVGTAIGNIVGFFTGIGDKIDRATKGMWDGIWQAFRSVINTLIRGWNSLKFTMPQIDLGPLGKVGGFTIGTPNIPYLHRGGIVPGLPGSDVPAILQAGEQVIPRNKAGGGDVHIHIGTFVGSGADIDRLADLIAQRMRLAGV